MQPCEGTKYTGSQSVILQWDTMTVQWTLNTGLVCVMVQLHYAFIHYALCPPLEDVESQLYKESSVEFGVEFGGGLRAGKYKLCLYRKSSF